MSFHDYVGTHFESFILPIIPAGASLSPGSKIPPENLGKIPGFHGDYGWYGFDWPRFRAKGKNLERFSGWYADRLAQIVGINSRELLGIDVDFDHADGANLIRDCAYETLSPRAPVRTRPNSEKLLLCYRLDFKRTNRRVTKIRRVFEDVSGKHHALEVLGDGQQWLMEGEHPSGVLYAWARDIRPVDLGWDHIPAVTADEVDAFVNEATERLIVAGFTPVKQSMSFSSGGTRSEAFDIGPDHPEICPDLDLLKQVLEVLPSDHAEFVDYDDWIKMVVALKTALGGREDHYELFEDWALPGHADNTPELIRSKWESFTKSSLGWDYIGWIAGKYGFTAHLGFEALPPLDEDDKFSDQAEPSKDRSAFRGPIPKLLPSDFDVRKLPTRQFVLGHRFMAGAMTVGVAAPGTGKSYMAIVSALAIATGRPLTEEPVHRQGRVWIHNNEEPIHELYRRIGGILRYHDIELADVRENIFVTSGLDERLIVAIKHKDIVRRTEAVAGVITEIKQRGIIHLVIDPFVSTYQGVSENANDEIEQVAQVLVHIAHATGCSIDLVHHSLKSLKGNTEQYAGNMNAARGASSLIGAARMVYTLSPMSNETATKMQLDRAEAGRLSRLDQGKGNYTARDQSVSWFELAPFDLGNGGPSGDELFIDSDTIAVPVPWKKIKSGIDQATPVVDRETQRQAKLQEVRNVVVAAMPSTRCKATAVLPAIERAFAVKQSTARTLLKQAIPEGEEIAAEMKGQTYSVKIERDKRSAPHPMFIVRTPITVADEAA